MSKSVIFTSDGKSFTWVCPTCKTGYYGYLADEPVSGWDNPRWKRTDGPNGISLTPSLGCSGLRDGTCTGHWWFREGRMVPA
jgi:hypothetical protein